MWVCLMANREDLDAAKNSLTLRDIRLRSSAIDVEIDDDKTVADLLFDRDRNFQSHRGASKIIETESESDVESKFLYTIRYMVAMRLIKNTDDTHAQEDAEGLVTIVATFDASYFSPVKLTKEELDAYAENNVGYHVWPYWREYVQSTCQRIGMEPSFPIPVYILE